MPTTHTFPSCVLRTTARQHLAPRSWFLNTILPLKESGLRGKGLLPGWSRENIRGTLNVLWHPKLKKGVFLKGQERTSKRNNTDLKAARAGAAQTIK